MSKLVLSFDLNHFIYIPRLIFLPFMTQLFLSISDHNLGLLANNLWFSKRKGIEEPTNETQLNEHVPRNGTNSLDSSPASNSISSDATDSETESDEPQGSNDDVDDTSDEVDEADLDEDDTDSMKEINIAGNRKQSMNENSRLDYRPSSCRYSKRLAGVDGFAVPETTHMGAKNRLRQRPTVNTAAESVVVPDSEDEN